MPVDLAIVSVRLRGEDAAEPAGFIDPAIISVGRQISQHEEITALPGLLADPAILSARLQEGNAKQTAALVDPAIVSYRGSLEPAIVTDAVAGEHTKLQQNTIEVDGIRALVHTDGRLILFGKQVHNEHELGKYDGTTTGRIPQTPVQRIEERNGEPEPTLAPTDNVHHLISDGQCDSPASDVPLNNVKSSEESPKRILHDTPTPQRLSTPETSSNTSEALVVAAKTPKDVISRDAGSSQRCLNHWSCLSLAVLALLIVYIIIWLMKKLAPCLIAAGLILMYDPKNRKEVMHRLIGEESPD
jgi:hypothetical protein